MLSQTRRAGIARLSAANNNANKLTASIAARSLSAGQPPQARGGQAPAQGLPRPSFAPPQRPGAMPPTPHQRPGGAPQQPQAGGKVIFDVGGNDFKQMVLDSPVPVILDCWAEWCGPCKQLTPVLEQAVRAQGGRVRLAKLDTDKHPQMAQQLGIKSLPTVMMVSEGKLVDQFVGFTGEAKVKEFVAKAASLAKVGGPQGGDAANDLVSMHQMIGGVLEMLKAASAAGKTSPISKEEMVEMIGALRTLASQKLDPLPQGTPKTPKRRADEDSLELIRGLAHAGLVRCALLDGNDEAAKEIAQATKTQFSKMVLENPEVKSALSLASLAAGVSASDSKRAELEARIKSNPKDSDARLELAKALFAEGAHGAAIEQALDLLRKDRTFKDGAARTLLLDIFNALGGSNDIVKEARRKMSSILMN